MKIPSQTRAGAQLKGAVRTPMKVLMTTDTVGGVWTYTLELCAALSTFGINVHLATMGRTLSAEQHRQLEALPNVQLHESLFRLCWMQDAWDDVAAAGHWLLNLEDRLKPDLIHLNDLAHGNLPWQAPVLLVGHSCVYSWHQAVRGTPPDKHWLRYCELVRASIATVDLLVAPSRAMLESLRMLYGPVMRSRVIYNGRDLLMTQEKTWEQLSAEKELMILAGGRLWDEAKNTASLTIIARHLHWPLYIAGETVEPGTQTAKSALEAKTPADDIHYLGLLDHRALSHWLNRASIYAAPAYYEPFGLGILEAAQAGCALVLGDIPSLRELWQDAAVFVPPDDPVILGRQLNLLAQRDRDRRQLARRAWRRAQQFSTRGMAADYFQCYQSLLSDRARTQIMGALP